MRERGRWVEKRNREREGEMGGKKKLRETSTDRPIQRWKEADRQTNKETETERGSESQADLKFQTY